MIRFSSLVFLFLFLSDLTGQDTIRLVQGTYIPVQQVQEVEVDPLGNLYVLTSIGAIEKYDGSGSKRTVFTQNRLGNPSAIFARNALKVFVWYPDFRTIIVLDRNLVQLGGALNLMELGLQNAIMLGPSVDGNIWLYDEVRFKLLKISPDGTLLAESQGLDLLLQRRISIQTLVDNGQQVIAYDPLAGLMFFDLFGQFKRQLIIDQSIEQLQLTGSQLQWLDSANRLVEMAIGFPTTEKSWVLPKTLEAGRKKLVPNGFITWDPKGVQVWSR